MVAERAFRHYSDKNTVERYLKDNPITKALVLLIFCVSFPLENLKCKFTVTKSYLLEVATLLSVHAKS